MKILLTGGTGALGERVVPLLVREGHEVVAVSRRPEASRWLMRAGAEPLRLDLLDPAQVGLAASDVQAIVNLATAIPQPPRSLVRRSWSTNDQLRRDASRVLAAAAIESGARFVQESFAPTYPDRADRWITEDQELDPTPHTATVVDAEASAERVTSVGEVGVVLRFGLFYGGRASGWLEYGRRGRLMLPGSPDAYASLIHVDDAARAVLTALSVPAGIYNVVDDEPVVRAGLAEQLAAALGGVRIRLQPPWTKRISTLRVLARSQRISNRLLRTVSDWRPTASNVREGWARAIHEATDG